MVCWRAITARLIGKHSKKEAATRQLKLMAPKGAGNEAGKKRRSVPWKRRLTPDAVERAQQKLRLSPLFQGAPADLCR